MFDGCRNMEHALHVLLCWGSGEGVWAADWPVGVAVAALVAGMRLVTGMFGP